MTAIFLLIGCVWIARELRRAPLGIEVDEGFFISKWCSQLSTEGVDSRALEAVPAVEVQADLALIARD